MKLDKNNNPDFRAHLGRHGHNLSHDFSFTSGTGHLLTVFSELMYPKDTIRGNVQMFTRTQPLLMPANVEVDENIDYFFVPLDMLYSAFGDYLYQVNEPYSDFVKNINKTSLPVCQFNEFALSYYTHFYGEDSDMKMVLYRTLDEYDFDNEFFSYYRNYFHNGLNPNSLLGSLTSFAVPFDSFQPNILPLTLMAYNAVYEHYYRIDEREPFLPNIYNIDVDIYSGGSPFLGVGVESYNRWRKAFSLKYHPKNRDYFTSNSPKPFFTGASNMVSTGSDLTRINNYLSSSGIYPRDASVESTSLGDATQLAMATGGAPYIPTGGIRNMFAVEKLLSITSRTKKTYDAQVLAHLGVDVPVDVKHEIQYVGSQHGLLKIGEVVSTAGTNDTPLGDIAGKGYGVLDDKVINFTAPVHGIFIGIYSAVPKYRYYVGLEKRNMITDRLDFFTPEYEKLGMQPLFYYELVASNSSNTQNTVIGWQMRYEQYKRRFNKVSPAFIDTLIKDAETGTSEPLSTFNQWRSWVIARRPLDYNVTPFGYGINSYLCSPYELNGLMALDYLDEDGWDQLYVDNPAFFLFQSVDTPAAQRTSFAWNVAQLFYRDPLLHFAKCDFKIVNKMQDNTLPDFID